MSPVEKKPVRAADRVLQAAAPLIEDILVHEGLELVDVVYQREPHGWVLRVLIDRQGGVTLDDCSHISHQISDVLDVKDVMRGAYHLEVSSPGLNRPLRTRRDFSRFAGSTVRIRTCRPLEGRRNFKGRLLGCEGDAVSVLVEGTARVLPIDLIARAHVEYDFGAGKKQP
jgi:ribosome maturation factor RimP